jgi:hypothetical protein
MSTATHARIDRSTTRALVPVPLGPDGHPSQRVRLAVSGTWNDPSADPTPARLELRMLGAGRPNHPAGEDGRLVTSKNLTVDLLPRTSGVEVTVQYKALGMNLLVLLVPMDA